MQKNCILIKCADADLADGSHHGTQRLISQISKKKKNWKYCDVGCRSVEGQQGDCGVVFFPFAQRQRRGSREMDDLPPQTW